MACLDTTVLIDLLRPRRASVVTAAIEPLLRAGATLCTTRINAAELYVGVERARDSKVEGKSVAELLSRLVMLEFNESAARQFGRFTAHLQQIGRPAGDMDVLIASIAMTHGLPLVTRNPNHFTDLPGVQVVSYR